MTDSETSKSNGKISQESGLSDEDYRNGGNNDADGEDAESGIGNEYIAVDVERTGIGGSSGTRNTNESSASEYSEGMSRGKVSANVERKTSRRHTEGDVVNQSSEGNAGLRRHTFADNRRNYIEENDYRAQSTASRLSGEDMKRVYMKNSINFDPNGSRRHTEGDLVSQSSERNAGLRRHTFAGSRRNNIYEDDYRAKSTASRLSGEEIKQVRDSINFDPKGSRRHTDGDLLNQISAQNACQRRQTFAGSRRNYIEENDDRAKSTTSRLSGDEMNRVYIKDSIEFDPKGSRRHTEGDVVNQSSERNAGPRRHTFAGSRPNNIEENDYRAGSTASRLSGEEMKRVYMKDSIDFGPKGSRRHTEGDVVNQSSERNAGPRRHTFAGSRPNNIEENDYRAGSTASRLSGEEMKRVYMKDSIDFGPKGSRRHTEGDLVNQSSERNAGPRRHTFAGSRPNNIEENDYRAQSTASRLSGEEMKRVYMKNSINFDPNGSRRHTEGDLVSQSSERNAGLRRHTFAGSRRNNIYEDDYRAKSTASRLSGEEMTQVRDSINFYPNGSRRHSEGDLVNESSERNGGRRRHTFAGNRPNNIEENYYRAKSTASRLSGEEMKPVYIKDSINFDPRRYTEGDLVNQSSTGNAGLRRHTFAGSRPNNIEENYYRAKSTPSRLSGEEPKQAYKKDSIDFDPKGSRRHTDGDLLNQTSALNDGQRRQTFAGTRPNNIEENDYRVESTASRLSGEEMKRVRDSINFDPKGSRRHTEGYIPYQTPAGNGGQRRQTFAGSRRIYDDDYQTETNTSRLTKSFSDSGIDVAKDFNNSDNLFRLQNSNISRRHTIVNDIVEGRRALPGKTVEEDSGNTSRFSNKGKRHTIADIRVRGNSIGSLGDDNRYPETGTFNDADISTSEKEQNLRRIRGQYKAFKRHTIAGYGSEYKHGRTPSRYWFNRQFSAPKSAILKRHTIAGTSRDMDVLRSRNEQKSLQNLPRSYQRIKYSEDKGQPRRSSTIHRNSVDEIQEDSVQDYIPIPLEKHSVLGQEYVRDVILDKGEDIRKDSLPRESSLLRRHTWHTGRQDNAVILEPQARRRATHPGFVQHHHFTSQAGFNDEQSPNHRESRPVERRNTGTNVGYGVNELPVNNERLQDHSIDEVDSDTRNNSVYGHPFEYRDSLYPDEKNYDIYDNISGDDGQIERFYLYNDHETDRSYVPQTPRNSSPYILSDNKLHIHQADPSRGTNIFVEDTNPINSMKIQTPGLTITTSGPNDDRANEMGRTRGGTTVEQKEVLANQHSKDVNTGAVSSNCFAVSSPVAPLLDNRVNEGGAVSGLQMIPTRNIFLRGQDGRGSKLKYNLSVIEEEGDEEHNRELEMQSQKTKGDHVSTNGLETVTITENQVRAGESEVSENAPRFLENQERVQQPSTSIRISKHGVAINDDGRHEISISRSEDLVRKCSCNQAGALEEHCKIPCDKNDSDSSSIAVEQRGHVINGNTHSDCCQHSCCKQKKENGNNSGEHDVISKPRKSVQSEQIAVKTDQLKDIREIAVSKSSKSHRNKPCLPCCSLHCKYQLHHPICCWHMTKNHCGERKVQQSRNKLGELKETEDTSTSETAESDVRNGEKTQGGVQDPRPPRDTSSERGDYMTAQESSITENDFNDIKFHLDGGPSSVLRKTRNLRGYHLYKYVWKPALG